MDEEGVTQIDTFVCTHDHEDHYGRIDDLVNDYNVRVLETYDRGEKNRMAANRMTDIRVGFIRRVEKLRLRRKFALRFLAGLNTAMTERNCRYRKEDIRCQ